MKSQVPIHAKRQHAPQVFALLLAAALFVAGCARGPAIIVPELRKPIDRGLVERPANLDIERFITHLTAPTAMAFDRQKNALLIAESGIGGDEPGILGFSFVDGSTFVVYPRGKRFLGLRSNPFQMYGPIGGMTIKDGVIYVSHRDADGMGVISAVTYDGKGSTIVAGLPAQGDYGVTDVVFGPDGRLYFGVGSATNSGVVGLDNWEVGWPQKHPKLADKYYKSPSGMLWRLRGSKFFTSNPLAGLFTGSELAITAPAQGFGEYTRSKIVGTDKPNAAVYSVKPTGGIANDLRIEAHGIRLPSGLAFNSLDTLFVSNQGMEARGTRPVMDDPNTILRIYRGRWYGWPDFSADLSPITDERFQPPEEQIRKTGYTELNFLFDHTPDLGVPFDLTDRDLMVRGKLPPLAGASKMTFVPDDDGPLKEFRGQLIVTLSGDRAPFAIEKSGRPLANPVGYKVVRVDVDGSSDNNVRDFVRNTAAVPRSLARGHNADLLERPIDAKFGPDGSLYILDMGQVESRNGKQHVTARSGQVYRVYVPGAARANPTTTPTTRTPESSDNK